MKIIKYVISNEERGEILYDLQGGLCQSVIQGVQDFSLSFEMISI